MYTAQRRNFLSSFNTQPPEGGWGKHTCLVHICIHVSTHSRPKAAGLLGLGVTLVSYVSTHSRPKAAGKFNGIPLPFDAPFQHTAARRRLGYMNTALNQGFVPFQHTAARRRLGS